MMVRKIILSAYSSDPPTEPGRVKIDVGGPLYDLVRVQALVADERRVFLWTEKCRKDVFKFFDSDLEQVAGLIQGLHARDYIDSEWCENGKGGLAACDAYRMRRLEHIATAGRSMSIEYFVKFAIGKTGQLVLVVSCHV
jgi:hypothetical protein